MQRTVFFTLLAFACYASAEVLSSGGCDNALFVPGPYNGQVVFGDTTNAPTYHNRCNLNSNGGTYFYVITPEANAAMNITTCHADTAFDTVLAVYQGDDCDSLECVTTNDDTTCSEAGNASSVEFNPNGGTYWVMVSGYSSNEGQFEISFKQSSAAVNSCEDAVTIHGPFTTPVSVFDSLVGNITNAQQPCNMNSVELGNWYIIYPTPGAEVTVTTCGDYYDFDTELAVLVGDSCDDLSCVAYSDDNCGTYSALSTVTFSADDAPFFFVYVTGFSSSSGSYYLTISEEVSQAPAPSGSPGTNCANAYPLPGPGEYTGFSNIGGDTVGAACSSSSDGCRTTWFVITPPSGTTATVTTCAEETDFDTVLLSFSSCSLGSCTNLNDDSDCHYGDLFSSLSEFSVGSPIYFAVIGYNCQVGDFGITVSYN